MRTSDFERLYAEHAGDVLSFLAYRIGDRHLAEDLTADAFERIYRARRRFDPRRASEKTWVYAVALNCLRSHIRHERTANRALPALAADGAAPEAGFEQVEVRDLLRRSFQVLSEAEREVFALRYGGDLSLPEIARVTGTSRTTAEGRLYGGLRKLREHVQAAGPPSKRPTYVADV